MISIAVSLPTRPPPTASGIFSAPAKRRSFRRSPTRCLRRRLKNAELLQIMRELGLKSYIGVPLTVRGKTLGVLTFIVAETGHIYDDTDLAVAKDLANRTAIAVENSQLYRELRDADQRKDEFLATLAHELRNPLAPIRNGLQVLQTGRCGRRNGGRNPLDDGATTYPHGPTGRRSPGREPNHSQQAGTSQRASSAGDRDPSAPSKQAAR